MGSYFFGGGGGRTFRLRLCLLLFVKWWVFFCSCWVWRVVSLLRGWIRGVFRICTIILLFSCFSTKGCGRVV